MGGTPDDGTLAVAVPDISRVMSRLDNDPARVSCGTCDHPPTAHGGWDEGVLCSLGLALWRGSRPGLNRDCRMLIGPSASDFHIQVQTPETTPSSSTAQSAPNHTCRFQGIFASHSVYQDLPCISTSDSLSRRPMSPSCNARNTQISGSRLRPLCFSPDPRSPPCLLR